MGMWPAPARTPAGAEVEFSLEHDPWEGCADMGGDATRATALGPSVELPLTRDPYEGCAEIGAETLRVRPYGGRKWSSIWGTTGVCRHGRGTACERSRWGMQREGREGGRKRTSGAAKRKRGPSKTRGLRETCFGSILEAWGLSLKALEHFWTPCGSPLAVPVHCFLRLGGIRAPS